MSIKRKRMKQEAKRGAGCDGLPKKAIVLTLSAVLATTPLLLVGCDELDGPEYLTQVVLDEAGNIVTDENGNPIYEVVTDENGNPVEKEALTVPEGEQLFIEASKREDRKLPYDFFDLQKVLDGTYISDYEEAKKAFYSSVENLESVNPVPAERIEDAELLFYRLDEFIYSKSKNYSFPIIVKEQAGGNTQFTLYVNDANKVFAIVATNRSNGSQSIVGGVVGGKVYADGTFVTAEHSALLSQALESQEFSTLSTNATAQMFSQMKFTGLTSRVSYNHEEGWYGTGYYSGEIKTICEPNGHTYTMKGTIPGNFRVCFKNGLGAGPMSVELRTTDLVIERDENGKVINVYEDPITTYKADIDETSTLPQIIVEELQSQNSTTEQTEASAE